MAVIFAPKPEQAIQFYSWKPALIDGDSISSFTLTGNGVTVESSDNRGDEILMYLSGGTTSEVASIAASVDTGFGEILKETIYVPVYGPGNMFAASAEDVIDFALRNVVGKNGTRSAVETADALEVLNAMLSSWTMQGADIGIAFPILIDSTIFAKDAYLSAIKYNLRQTLEGEYNWPTTRATAFYAKSGLQLIKNANLPDDRGTADYY
jgi:hypothetical protein